MAKGKTIARTKVLAALEALGLEGDQIYSVQMKPHLVSVSRYLHVDGQLVIQDGVPVTTNELFLIHDGKDKK